MTSEERETTREEPARHSKLSPWKRWLSLRGYGAFTSTLFGAMTSPHKMRSRFERFGRVSRAAMQAKHRGLVFEDHTLGRLGLEAVRAVDSPSSVILHLHGGAYFMGSVASYRNRAMRLSYRCSAEVFVPEYRLAPEHVFPAALEDAVVAFQYVKALRPRVPVFVTGDSAGGGLALSLMLRLRELGHDLPDGAILLSPWVDLTDGDVPVDRNGDGAATPARKDLWFTRRHLKQWATYYVGKRDPTDPLISPVFAELSSLPPLLVLVGEDEILHDEALMLVERARAAGTDARLLVGPGMQHDWPLTLPWLDESRDAWDAMVRFVGEQRAR